MSGCATEHALRSVQRPRASHGLAEIVERGAVVNTTDIKRTDAIHARAPAAAVVVLTARGLAATDRGGGRELDMRRRGVMLIEQARPAPAPLHRPSLPFCAGCASCVFTGTGTCDGSRSMV